MFSACRKNEAAAAKSAKAKGKQKAAFKTRRQLAAKTKLSAAPCSAQLVIIPRPSPIKA